MNDLFNGSFTGIAIATLLASWLVITLVFMWVWNTTFTQLFNFKTLSFVNAVKIGLLLLIISSGGQAAYTVTTTNSHSYEITDAGSDVAPGKYSTSETKTFATPF